MQITQEKLNEIITSHSKWLKDEEGGQPANLLRACLRNAGLSGADLRGADLDDYIVQVVRIGSRKGTTTYNATTDNVLCGCWNSYKGGTLVEFKARVESVYGAKGETPNKKYYAEYMAAIKFFNEMRSWKND